jgi:hypothetical protein
LPLAADAVPVPVNEQSDPASGWTESVNVT